MTLTGNLRENLRESRTVHAVAGAGDLAVEKLREVPEQVLRARETARETATRYQGDVRETVGRYRENVGKVEVKDLTGVAAAYVSNVGVRAAGFIDELAERGRKVVRRDARPAEPAEITGADPARDEPGA
ncbi:hypothetical protein [Actinomadura roseirufa]|uniref:hypothetical protein n=1 Tax=Actinomadura roseirufa TaxID=2094049 RepID=UPI00104144A5|nr:hypothetical protein [Actinomadura roseirufa]